MTMLRGIVAGRINFAEKLGNKSRRFMFRVSFENVSISDNHETAGPDKP
jgi:hypothetical protein